MCYSTARTKERDRENEKGAEKVPGSSKASNLEFGNSKAADEKQTGK